MSDVVAEAARATKGAISFIEIEEADAIAKRIPALEKLEVEQGAFGGRPPRPAESFETLAFSVRLVTSPKSDVDKIAELVRQLYLIRQNISAAVTGAGLMETPDLDEPTPFLIHPGMRAYVNGDQRNLFDRYSDYIYLGAFLISGLGSVVAGMFGYLVAAAMTTGRRRCASCRSCSLRRASRRPRRRSTSSNATPTRCSTRCMRVASRTNSRPLH